MRRILAIWMFATLSGCAVVGELWKLVGANILGVMPKEGFSNPESEDYGKVAIAVAGESLQMG